MALIGKNGLIDSCNLRDFDRPARGSGRAASTRWQHNAPLVPNELLVS
jgi:hypothetical protein